MSVARHPRPKELEGVPIEDIMKRYVGRFTDKKASLRMESNCTRSSRYHSIDLSRFGSPVGRYPERAAAGAEEEWALGLCSTTLFTSHRTCL